MNSEENPAPNASPNASSNASSLTPLQWQREKQLLLQTLKKYKLANTELTTQVNDLQQSIQQTRKPNNNVNGSTQQIDRNLANEDDNRNMETQQEKVQFSNEQEGMHQDKKQEDIKSRNFMLEEQVKHRIAMRTLSFGFVLQANLCFRLRIFNFKLQVRILN